MTSELIGHNGGPDIDGRRHTIRTAWAKALFADPTTPSYVMAIAWAIHWYSRADGTGAALSNAQLQVICGISQPTATRGKKWLRDNGYVHLKVGTGDQKTEFSMAIPERQSWVVQEERVIPLTTQPQTTQGEITQGNPSDEGGVICGLLYNQERDSRLNQDSTGASPPSVEKPAKKGGIAYWQDQLNPTHSDYLFDGGTLSLLNGTRTKWLLEFGDDERRLEFALNEVAGRLQLNSSKSIEVQVKAGLSKIAARKLDQAQNYQNARAKSAEPAETSRQRLRRFVEEEAEKVSRGGQS